MSGCQVIRFEGGGHAIVCGRSSISYKAPCRFCGNDSQFTCGGWKTDKPSGTCDLPICAEHRTHTPAGRDLCPDCVK